jgi:hypothetical protein
LLFFVIVRVCMCFIRGCFAAADAHGAMPASPSIPRGAHTDASASSRPGRRPQAVSSRTPPRLAKRLVARYAGLGSNRRARIWIGCGPADIEFLRTRTPRARCLASFSACRAPFAVPLVQRCACVFPCRR